MKSIYKKINISYTLTFIIFLSFISGLFKDIITLFSIIIIHECGHVIASLIFKWKIKSINIGMCGGFIYYDEQIDKPFIEEFLISVSGFLFQIIYFFFVFLFYKNNLIDIKTFYLIKKYNMCILLFNVLPIIPLDGSKIVNLFLNIFMPYKQSLKVLNIISFLSLSIIIVFFLMFKIKFEYSYIMMFCFLSKSLIKSIKDIPYLFNRFLFQRYNNPINTNKYNYIKGSNLNYMKRQKKHLFFINNRAYTEKSILSKKFD